MLRTSNSALPFKADIRREVCFVSILLQKSPPIHLMG
jgi:hypothetical protein